jgi:hypothetical protein
MFLFITLITCKKESHLSSRMSHHHQQRFSLMPQLAHLQVPHHLSINLKRVLTPDPKAEEAQIEALEDLQEEAMETEAPRIPNKDD